MGTNRESTEYKLQNEEKIYKKRLSQIRESVNVNPNLDNTVLTRNSKSTSKWQTSDEPKMMLGPYEFVKECGVGSFGVVYRARNVNTDQIVAIKRVLQDSKYRNRELEMMKMVNHPNIVKFIDSYVDTHNEKVYLSLVLEYMPLNLHQCQIKYDSKIPLYQVKLYTYQLLKSLSYIHMKGICHRDIKPQNLLLDKSECEVKLCDFGSAKILNDKSNITYICSRYYRAPELILEAKKYTTAIDIWSAGCILAELLLGKPLFAGDTQTSQLILIIRILGTPSSEDLISIDPSCDLTGISKVIPYPWKHIFPPSTPPEAVELLTKMLLYNPNSRITALKACSHPFFDELRSSYSSSAASVKLSHLFDFSPEEIKIAREANFFNFLLPSHLTTISEQNDKN